MRSRFRAACAAVMRSGSSILVLSIRCLATCWRIAVCCSTWTALVDALPDGVGERSAILHAVAGRRSPRASPGMMRSARLAWKVMVSFLPRIGLVLVVLGAGGLDGHGLADLGHAELRRRSPRRSTPRIMPLPFLSAEGIWMTASWMSRMTWWPSSSFMTAWPVR